MSCTAGATTTPRPATPIRVGEVAALLTTVTVSLAAPPASGLKLTSKVMELLGATVAGPLGGLLGANPGPPPTVMLLTTRSAVPVLLMVKVWEALSPTRVLPKSWLAGLTSMAGAMPVPESRTEAPPASLAIETVSPAAPTASGAKVTSKVTKLPGAMGESAGRLRAKPAAPPRLLELTVRSALPVLLMVTVCGPLVEPTSRFPKLKLAGLTSMAGATPVPESETVGEPASLVTVTVSPARPVPAGVKVTSKVTKLPGAMGESAGKLRAKPAAPPGLMLETVRSAEPVFVMVTVWARLVEPSRTLPKLRLVGLTSMAGAVPAPESATAGE